ncbi:MAG: phosphoglycerate mutase family protein [Pseudomonadota bacterium]
MSIEIFLVRHAEAAADWGSDPDPGLSSLGHEQAQSAAGDLRPQLPPNVNILTSPMLRAQETAAPLVQVLQHTPIVDARFREVPAPVPFSERATWIREFFLQNWQSQPEPLLQWRAAILEALNELTQPTVVFTHFVVVNTVVAAINKDDRTLVFRPDYTSTTRLVLDDDGLRLTQLGAERHSVVI